MEKELEGGLSHRWDNAKHKTWKNKLGHKFRNTNYKKIRIQNLEIQNRNSLLLEIEAGEENGLALSDAK